MSYFKAKMHQNPILAGVCGAYVAPQTLQLDLRGSTKWRGWERRERKEWEEKGDERRRVERREDRGREERG